MSKKKGKKRIRLTKAEVRELSALLKEGLPAGEVDGREAAFNDLVDKELCRDLASSFAGESARKKGDAIGDVRDSYGRIVIELLAARYTQTDGKRYSLSTVLRGKYESDSALKEFLPKFAKWIGEYVSDCIREHTFGFTPLYRQIVPSHTWTLCRHSVSRQLLTALAEEYVRDRVGLMRFLSSCFERWREINKPDSLWRVRLVTQQTAGHYGYDRKRILDHLQEIGAMPNPNKADQTYALLSRIGQYLSRDQRAAVRKNRGDRNPLVAS
jgi:hypothetical protein